ncbi:MAG TPA: radical SAM protein [Gemmatimonadales bacterium]|nr:radical SAM protein [Gemmatimonadales bacterium]
MRQGQLELPVLAPVPRRLEVLDQRARGTTFLELSPRSVLNSSASTRMGFWSVNPYVGCEFGCTYCYARDTHRYAVERATASSQPDPEDADVPLPPWLAFERRILVKTTAPEVLARTLDPARLNGQSLVIGTATDPYQPAERRFRITRRLLEVLLRFRDLSIGIITKSPLIARDAALLRSLSGRHEVTIHLSIATADRVLARRLEPRSPVPEARLRALGRLSAAGVYGGLLIAPIVPGITDDRPGLGRLMAAGREVGARYVVGSALRLGPAARRRFLPHLEREFPELAERYRRHFADGEGVSAAYQAALTRRLRSLQEEHGYPLDEGYRRRRQLEAPAATPAAALEQPLLL